MRKFGMAAGLALALSWASPAAAETILFDTNGGAAGGVMNATVFDWAPGNSLIVEHSLTEATIYYQANLNVVQDNAGGGFLNGTGGSFFTAVASFDVTLIPGAPGATTYTVDAGTGLLQIYVDDERGNNLSGLGFADSTEILRASVTSGGGSFAFNLTPSAGNPTALDAFTSEIFGTVPEAPGNNYPNVLTLTGTGAADVTATVTGFNAAYFLNLALGTSVAFTNASQIDPYNQANPSATFAEGAVVGVGAVGPINGLGNTIIAQSDANTSFTGTAVPEPATLTLLGFGLAGSAMARRRQKKATN